MTTKAQSFKEKGNEAFKLTDFPTAIGHYTSAILADPTEPTYPLNRAAAYLKLRKYEDAERDCTRVLELSNNQNPKALFRRAQARRWIGAFDDANADLKAALKLEPTNQSVKQEIEIVQGLKEAQAQSKGARKPIDVTKPTDPWPPHPKRRKVPIKIVDPESLPPEDTVITASPTPAPKIEELKAVSSRTLAKSDDSATATITAAGDSSSQEQSPASPSAAPRKMGGGIFRASGRNTLFDLSSPPSTPPATSPQTSSTSTTASSSRLPREPPKTLYAFHRAWETCGSDEHQKWELLKTVPPQTLPQFLKTSLEPSLLASLLQILLRVSQEGEQVKPYMEGLGKVERIFTVLMFLSTGEKEVGREVLRRVGLDLGAGVWKALN
ncbi:TPR-like protein [Flagelloscypha sp. PMI_526]|nr:TPR-like protein [Flagelloscypha sp. PMI_526]